MKGGGGKRFHSLDLNDHLGVDVRVADHVAELLKRDLPVVVLPNTQMIKFHMKLNCWYYYAFLK